MLMFARLKVLTGARKSKQFSPVYKIGVKVPLNQKIHQEQKPGKALEDYALTTCKNYDY